MSAESATTHPVAPHTTPHVSVTRVASTIDRIAEITGRHPKFIFTTFLDALLYEYRGRPPTTSCPIRALAIRDNYTAHHTLTRLFATATAHLYTGVRETNRDLLTPLATHYTDLTTDTTPSTVIISTPRTPDSNSRSHVTTDPRQSPTTIVDILRERIASYPRRSHTVVTRTESEVEAKLLALSLGFLPATITGFVAWKPPDTDHPQQGYWIQNSLTPRIQAVRDT